MESLPQSLRFIQRDWLSCNQILLCDQMHSAGGFYTLIDTGYVKHQALTLQIVQHLMGTGQLKRIINTHLHSDHCGGNALLSAKTGCEIVIPQGSWADVQQWDMQALSFAALGQDCPRFKAQSSLAPGDVFEAGGLAWEVFASAGHDPKSFIYFCHEERILISADALWEKGFGILFPELHGDSGFMEQERVLNLIELLDPRLVLPGHGNLFIDLEGALAHARARLQALREKPDRNPRAALKALVKYLLLDREKVHIESFVKEQAQTKVNQACATQLNQPLEALLRQAMDELVKVKAARTDGVYAYNLQDLPLTA